MAKARKFPAVDDSRPRFIRALRSHYSAILGETDVASKEGPQTKWFSIRGSSSETIGVLTINDFASACDCRLHYSE
jgi:hypothetical protein